MNRLMLQNGVATGGQQWLVVALTLGLGLSTQVVAAKDCHPETSLLARVCRVTPSPEVPEPVAGFAGAWIGVWEGPGGREALYQTLVVEAVLANA